MMGRDMRTARLIISASVASGEMERVRGANASGNPCLYFRPVARP